MAGGGGKRLWPASTADRPKQLIPGLPRPGTTLLGATVDRLTGLVPSADVHVVTTREQRAAILEALPGVAPEHVMAEPFGRNTAPCIALAVGQLIARRSEAEAEVTTLIVLPADHHVVDEDGFRAHLEAACIHAEASGRIVTLGIQPDRPETGYGYMERDELPVPAIEGDRGLPVHAALRFVEKPDRVRAQTYLDSGRFLWNAGIFVMPLRRIADDLARLSPQTWSALAPVREAARAGTPSLELLADCYDRVTPEPIDVAVMEKLDDLLVVPASVGWTDLGSWASVAEVLKRDEQRNASHTAEGLRSMIMDSQDCMVWNESGTVGVVGLRDIAIVCVEDRVMVCPLERAQEVRALAAELETK